jgi:hypothetical protein
MAREGRGYIEGVELVALMLSELATNAVQHAGTEFEVDITMTREASLYRLRVGVTDQSPGLPVLPEPAADAPHGRGLRIVETLADAWGIEIRRGHPGKTVWFVARLVAKAPSGEVVDRIDRKEPRRAVGWSTATAGQPDVVTDFVINVTAAEERSADDIIVLSVRRSGAGGGGT